MLELRTDKNYSEIYGEERALEEREKRSKGVKKAWENSSDQNKIKKAKSCQKTYLEKSGYTKEMILEIRKLHDGRMKPRFILIKYPSLDKSDINKILDKRKKKNLE